MKNTQEGTILTLEKKSIQCSNVPFYYFRGEWVCLIHRLTHCFYVRIHLDKNSTPVNKIGLRNTPRISY